MGRGATTSALVIPYHASLHNPRNPFRLAFRTDAVILVKIGESSSKTTFFQLTLNEEEIRAKLDLLQEDREVAHVREYAAKARASQRYNARIFPIKLKKHDLVLKRVLKDNTSNKLTPNWEGPYRLIKEVGCGAYRLEHLNGQKVPRTWTLASLQKYYS
ncbi:hypothetical protein CR513_51500, partial [Mucuna pruriens]